MPRSDEKCREEPRSGEKLRGAEKCREVPRRAEKWQRLASGEHGGGRRRRHSLSSFEPLFINSLSTLAPNPLQRSTYFVNVNTLVLALLHAGLSFRGPRSVLCLYTGFRSRSGVSVCLSHLPKPLSFIHPLIVLPPPHPT